MSSKPVKYTFKEVSFDPVTNKPHHTRQNTGTNNNTNTQAVKYIFKEVSFDPVTNTRHTRNITSTYSDSRIPAVTSNHTTVDIGPHVNSSVRINTTRIAHNALNTKDFTPQKYKKIPMNEEGLDGFTVGLLLECGPDYIVGEKDPVMTDVAVGDRKLIISWPAYSFTTTRDIPNSPLTRGELALFIARAFSSFFELAVTKPHLDEEYAHMRFGTEGRSLQLDSVLVYAIEYRTDKKGWVLVLDRVGGKGPMWLK